MKTMILERFTSKGKILESDKAKLPDGVLCRAKYQICSVGKKNRNNRIYEREVWDKVLKDSDVVEKLNNKSLFFHAEHPTTTQSNAEKVAGVVTEIKLSGDKVYATMEVLETPYGKIIDTLLRAGCGIGVSTRADGELEECMDESGDKYSRVIPESYKFVTIDFTADPSSYGSEVPLEVQRNVAEVVKVGIDSEKIDRDYATVLLESLNVPEAKSILESMKIDKHHEGCSCKPSEKKCTNCNHSEAKENVEEDAYQSPGKNDKFAGWIAIYGGKKIEIKKDEADGLWGAKKLAIERLKVPKSKEGLLAIEPAYEDEVTESKVEVTTPDLDSVDIESLDPLERQYFDKYSKTMSKEEALQIIINTVEGDWSQLSAELQDRAQKDTTWECKDVDNELNQLKLELNAAYKVGDKSAVADIQHRIDGLSKVNEESGFSGKDFKPGDYALLRVFAISDFAIVRVLELPKEEKHKQAVNVEIVKSYVDIGSKLFYTPGATHIVGAQELYKNLEGILQRSSFLNPVAIQKEMNKVQPRMDVLKEFGLIGSEEEVHRMSEKVEETAGITIGSDVIVNAGRFKNAKGKVTGFAQGVNGYKVNIEDVDKGGELVQAIIMANDIELAENRRAIVEAYEDRWKVGDEVLVGGDRSVGMQDWTGKITGIDKVQGVAFITGSDGEEEEVMLKNLYDLNDVDEKIDETLASRIKQACKELYPDRDFHTLNTTEHDNVIIKARELKSEDVNEQNLPDFIVEKLKKLPESGMGYQNVDFIMKDDSVIEKLKVMNCSVLLDGRKIKFENVSKINFRTIKQAVKEDVVVKGAVSKSHDFPIGLFWYDTKTGELDYEKYSEGLYHTKMKNYDKLSGVPTVLRGRVFKDGEKNCAVVYTGDFSSFNFAMDKMNDLYTKLVDESGVSITFVVDEVGNSLVEKRVNEKGDKKQRVGIYEVEIWDGREDDGKYNVVLSKYSNKGKHEQERTEVSTLEDANKKFNEYVKKAEEVKESKIENDDIRTDYHKMIMNGLEPKDALRQTAMNYGISEIAADKIINESVEESLKRDPFVFIDGKTYKIFRGEGAIAEVGDEENKIGISTFEPEIQKKIIRRLEEGLEDFVTPGSTEIWYFKDDYARDALMGSEWLKDKGTLPDPENLENTHTLLGTISLEDPEQIYSQMQGESWSPSGEAREFIQDLGLSHTSMSVGDVMVINGKPTMVDSLGFYDLSGESKSEVSTQESHYNEDSKKLINEGRTPEELKDLIKDHYKQVTDPGEADVPRMSKAEAIKHLALITMRSEKEIIKILKNEAVEAVQASINVPDEKVNQFLNDNWGQFLNNEDAVNNLVKVFKISAAKAKSFVDKTSQGQGQLSLQYQLESKLKKVLENYGKDCIKYSNLIEELNKKSESSLKEYSIKIEEVKRDKELAEKKAQEDVASLKESISKLNEKIEESKKSNEIKIKELKEVHSKELLKMYTETKIKCMGLKLNERRLTILESCISTKEIDEQIREFQNMITESALQFNGASEINISVTPEKQDPKQVEIDRKVGSAMSAWTGGTNK